MDKTDEPVAERPTDTQLIEEAIAVGLAFQPQDEVSEVFLPFDAEEPLDEELVNFARAVLARYGHQPTPPVEGADCPACEGVPKPGNQPCAVCGRSASSVEGEVAEMAWWLRSLEDASVWFESGSPEALKLTRAADLLEQRHPAPVPVAERLPGPEDCLDEGWAWFFSPRVGWRQAVLPVSPAFTHWLPATALPLPSGEAE